MVLKKSQVNLYFDQRIFLESWNNIFQYIFQAEKRFEIAMRICLFSFHALYLKINREIEKQPKIFEK